MNTTYQDLLNTIVKLANVEMKTPCDKTNGPSAREYNRQLWINRVADWECSNMSQGAFCKKHNIGLASFCRWKSIFKKEMIDCSTVVRENPSVDIPEKKQIVITITWPI